MTTVLTADVGPERVADSVVAPHVALGGPHHRCFVPAIAGSHRIVISQLRPSPDGPAVNMHEWWDNPTLPVPDFETVTYNRHRAVYDEHPDASLIVYIASDYEPTHEDGEWIGTNIGKGIAIALGGGFVDDDQDAPPPMSFSDIMETLRNEMRELADRIVASADEPSGTWRQFFDALEVPDTDVSDGMVMDYGPERCWRCDATEATTKLGLCDDCDDDLKGGE